MNALMLPNAAFRRTLDIRQALIGAVDGMPGIAGDFELPYRFPKPLWQVIRGSLEAAQAEHPWKATLYGFMKVHGYVWTDPRKGVIWFDEHPDFIPQFGPSGVDAVWRAAETATGRRREQLRQEMAAHEADHALLAKRNKEKILLELAKDLSSATKGRPAPVRGGLKGLLAGVEKTFGRPHIAETRRRRMSRQSRDQWRLEELLVQAASAGTSATLEALRRETAITDAGMAALKEVLDHSVQRHRLGVAAKSLAEAPRPALTVALELPPAEFTRRHMQILNTYTTLALFLGGVPLRIAKAVERQGPPGERFESLEDLQSLFGWIDRRRLAHALRIGRFDGDLADLDEDLRKRIRNLSANQWRAIQKRWEKYGLNEAARERMQTNVKRFIRKSRRIFFSLADLTEMNLLLAQGNSRLKAGFPLLASVPGAYIEMSVPALAILMDYLAPRSNDFLARARAWRHRQAQLKELERKDQELAARQVERAKKASDKAEYAARTPEQRAQWHLTRLFPELIGMTRREFDDKLRNYSQVDPEVVPLQEGKQMALFLRRYNRARGAKRRKPVGYVELAPNKGRYELTAALEAGDQWPESVLEIIRSIESTLHIRVKHRTFNRKNFNGLVRHEAANVFRAALPAVRDWVDLSDLYSTILKRFRRRRLDSLYFHRILMTLGLVNRNTAAALHRRQLRLNRAAA